LSLALKILKWTALGIVLILILLTGFTFFLQDKMVNIFLNYADRTITTKIEAEKSSFSLIRNFPKASVRMEKVLVHSSSGFDRTQFKKKNTDTLLFAKSVICEFKITDIIKGRYILQSIIIKNGRLYLFSDSSGGVNYDISFGKSAPGDKEFVLNLDKINVSGLYASYINNSTHLNISGQIKNGSFKSRISGNVIDLTANSSMLLSAVEIFPVSLNTASSVTLDLNLHKSDSGIYFRKGFLKIDNNNIIIAGNISGDNKVNLKITGNNIDISKIKKFLPERYRTKYSEYDPAGILKLDCRLTGMTDRLHNPEIKVNFSLEKGHVYYKKSNIKIEKISFSGSFSNGKNQSWETSLLNINQAEATLGTAKYSGSFKAQGLSRPRINLSVAGEVIPSEISEFFDIKEISWAKGSAGMNLKLAGILLLKDKYTLSDLMRLHPVADIHFDSMGLGLDSNKIVLSGINGKMRIGRDVRADSLSFNYKDQYFQIDGDFINLPSWLAGQPVLLKAAGDVAVSDFRPEFFVPDSSSTEAGQPAYSFPKGIELDFNCDISNMIYRKLSAGRIKGKLIYKRGLFSFKNLDITSLDGNISGEYFFSQSEKDNFMSHGSFSIREIDVNRTFYSFNNFGQDFLKAENIAGTLSGKLSFQIPFDPKLNPVYDAITADGKYTLTDGALMNFEPMKSLSGFIELSELENIRFSKLENDFFIKSGYVTVPQMDIKSSAADFTISGKHGFENDYEYHVKTYLSVLLSKKAKKTRKQNSEFGAIEDDGLGRTSVFLKITGKGEDIKVGYDIKAAGSKIKKDFSNEKENLKRILNKEYGWYKKDSTIREEKTTKPRFRIQWDENDSTGILIDTSSVNKDKGINSIFKMKKKE
jgi:hypothetical protein